MTHRSITAIVKTVVTNLSLLGHDLKHLETLRGVVRTLSSCRGIENGEGCVQVGDEYVAGPFVDLFL